MPETQLRTERLQPPLPVLGEVALEDNRTIVSNRENAPTTVRMVRILAILCILLGDLVICLETGIAISKVIWGGGGWLDQTADSASTVLTIAVLIALMLWIIRGLQQVTRAAWYATLFVATCATALIVIIAPIGLFVLICWLRPEVRKWFGIVYWLTPWRDAKAR